MELTIRKAALADAPAMADIHARSWQAAYRGIIPDHQIAEKNAERPALWARVLSGEHDNYIALVGDAPVGLMSVHACLDEDLPDGGEVGAIYLHPDFWGRGFGREMMGFALDALKRRGFRSATLWVLEANLRARRFYENCGFAPDGARKDYPIGDVRIPEMRYRIEL